MTPTTCDAGKPAVHENGARGIVRRVYVSGDGRPMREEVRVEVTVEGAGGAPVGFLDPTAGWTLEAPAPDDAALFAKLHCADAGASAERAAAVAYLREAAKTIPAGAKCPAVLTALATAIEFGVHIERGPR